MLTIYTWPKSFEDKHIATIQRNAVRSWLQLRPKPAIFVFGNAPGTAEHCAELASITSWIRSKSLTGP